MDKVGADFYFSVKTMEDRLGANVIPIQLPIGSEGDFGIPDIDNPNFVRDWNASHPAIRLIIATPEEFFEYIEKNFGDKIPDGVTGGWGVSHDIEETTFAKPGARDAGRRGIWRAGPGAIRNHV